MKIRFEDVVKKIGLIKTEKEYRFALATVEKLMDAKEGTREESLLNILSILIEKYEDEKYPIPSPDPVSAIKFRLSQLGMTTKDLASFVGGKNRVSEILNKKRGLTIKMMKTLHNDLGVPAESLLST